MIFSLLFSIKLYLYCFSNVFFNTIYSFFPSFCSILRNNLNPVFIKEIRTDYRFEETQNLRIVVWDEDITSDDFIGKADFTMADVMTTAGRGFKIQLTDGSGKGNRGEVYIDAEAVTNVDACMLRYSFLLSFIFITGCFAHSMGASCQLVTTCTAVSPL